MCSGRQEKLITLRLIATHPRTCSSSCKGSVSTRDDFEAEGPQKSHLLSTPLSVLYSAL